MPQVPLLLGQSWVSFKWTNHVFQCQSFGCWWITMWTRSTDEQGAISTWYKIPWFIVTVFSIEFLNTCYWSIFSHSLCTWWVLTLNLEKFKKSEAQLLSRKHLHRNDCCHYLVSPVSFQEIVLTCFFTFYSYIHIPFPFYMVYKSQIQMLSLIKYIVTHSNVLL